MVVSPPVHIIQIMSLPSNHRHYQISAPQIAAISGAPLANVVLYWPLIFKALEAEDIADRDTIIAAIATIAIETPEFKPVDDTADDGTLLKKYEGSWSLGNFFAGDGVRYHRRGFIPLRGRSNYNQFGIRLGIDLLNQPEKANEPLVAARIFASFFRWRGVSFAARSHEWRKVRVLVSGTMNDWASFMRIICRLNATI